MKMLPSTRLGTQAATAVLIAVLFGIFFHFARSYWAILTAMFLIAQTFGESIKKAIERVFATILGGIVGTLIYLSLAHYPAILLALALINIFCLVYIFPASYSIGVFFITIFVVFIFAELSQWNFQTLEYRIIETCIGAVIAVISSAIVFPIRSRSQVDEQFLVFLDEIAIILSDAYNKLLTHKPITSQSSLNKLFTTYSAIQNNCKLSQYESLFYARTRKDLNAVMFQFQLLFHYATSVSAVASELIESKQIEIVAEEIKVMAKIIASNIEIINTKLRHQKTQQTFTTLIPARNQLRAKVAASLEQQLSQRQDWSKVFPLIFTTRKTNECLHHLCDLLD